MDSVLREGYIVGDYVDYRGKVYLIEGFRKILRQASLKELSNNEDRKYLIVRKWKSVHASVETLELNMNKRALGTQA